MRLVATSAGQTLSFPLRQGSTLIGRHSSCHVCIPSKTLSRRLCQCYVDGPNVTLRDLGSSHGTFVNGRRVERADLRHGDVLSLGGFELRFDAEGAVPTYGHGAGAAEDIVVTAEPTGVVMPGGPLPGAAPTGQGPTQPLDAELPPAAPTDAPASPGGEDTPADQSFMPVAYTPQRETVLGGGADQPQLVVREGRWFLRDPRSGREVEIAPAGGAGAVAAPAAALRRPNVRLLITVVAIAAIVVITFAVAILRPARRNTEMPKISDRAWAELVDAGLDVLKKGDYAKALDQFKLAFSKRSELEPARLLTQYALLLQTAAGDFAKLDKNEAKRYLESIENTRCPSDKAIAFAREQRVWIDKEWVSMGVIDGAKAKLAAAGENEELLIEVRSDLQQIPADRFAAKLAAAMIADIHKTIATNRLRRAEREKAQLKWAEAVAEYLAALPFIEDAALKARINKEVEDCRRYAQEAQAIRQAHDAITAKNYGTARSLLAAIKAGHYYQDAQRMLADIQRLEKDEALQAVRQQILKQYKEGAGEQAAKLAEDHKLQEFSYIRERIKRIEDLLAEGRKAEEDHLYREAEDKYQEAVGVEADPENEYRRRAERALKALKDRYPEIAAEFAAKVFPLVNKDPLQARKHAEEALKYDANNKRAKDGLDHLERQAKLLHNDGIRAAAEKKFHTAKDILKKALDSAPPGSPLYQRIAQELQKVLDQIGE
jgi:hypothetical protein